MQSLNSVQKAALNVGTSALEVAGPSLARITPIRRTIVHQVESIMLKGLEEARSTSQCPPGADEDGTLMGLAVVHSMERALADHHLSRATMHTLFKTVAQEVMIERGDAATKAAFKAQFGVDPPGLLLISPGKACNLHCTGCYADSGPTPAKLDWDVFDRIVTEAKTQWGTRFFAISGGEPLAYRSGGKGILDMAEKHRDCFFLMYTNGTLIDDEVAARLARAGNLTPALSIEGWRERTDARRGPGIFDQVVEAMGRLRAAGVIFGVSLTPTRENAEEILSDEFIDFCFEQNGSLYAWMFQYMPIGRSFTLDLMPTPQQRLWMWHRSWELIRNRRTFLADFWNHGTVSRGCIAAGRYNGGGYMYVDWNGAVSPCVFMPYSPVNINAVYEQGKTLNDVWAEPFFADIRGWQQKYKEDKGNWLMPCPMRDHHADLRKIFAEHEPEPMDVNARAALLDPEYARGLAEYDAVYQATSGPLWEEHYLRPGVPADGDIPPLPELP